LLPKQPNYFVRKKRLIYNRKKRKYIEIEYVEHHKTYLPRRAKRKDPHAYSMVYTRLQQSLVYFPDGRAFPDWLEAAPGAWSAENLFDANDQIKLVEKLVSKLRGSDFNMSVFLGEGHQTLSMIASTAIRVRRAIQQARRLNIYGAARAIFEGSGREPRKRHDWRRPGHTWKGDAASLWLELQYGWIPLLKDVEGAAQSLAHSLYFPFLKTYRTSVRKEVNLDVNRGDVGQGVIPSFKISKSCRRGLIAIIQEQPKNIAAELGLLDPELVAWELLPFSFVADWFIPIGQWMEMRAQAGRLIGTFITSDKWSGLAHSLSFSGTIAVASATTYSQVLFSRSVGSSLDVPMPNFKPLSKVASWQHCANALALLTQVFSSSPKHRG
jgi:hypothetical protein